MKHVRREDKKSSLFYLVCLLCFVICSSSVKADIIHPLEVFDSEHEYYGNPDLNLYVEVSNGGTDRVNFTFYNDSSIESSIARIYFDDGDGSLLAVAGIDGLGVSFSQPATPRNLPGAHLLDPVFETTNGLSFGADAPLPRNGINPGEWSIITFDLVHDKTLQDVIDGLNSEVLRIGAHIIALPDGSSAATITTPEPATVSLLALGGLALLKYKRFRY